MRKIDKNRGKTEKEETRRNNIKHEHNTNRRIQNPIQAYIKTLAAQITFQFLVYYDSWLGECVFLFHFCQGYKYDAMEYLYLFAA